MNLNPFALLGLAALGGALFLLSTNRAEAAPRQVQVFNPDTGGYDVYTVGFESFPEPFNPAIDVDSVASPMSDAEYNALLQAHGYAVPQDAGQAADSTDTIEDTMPDVVSQEQNLIAFLALIRQVEAKGDYNALVGGGRFDGYTDHPANAGWPGIRRADDGRLTTAAGAYQITRTTWNDIRKKVGLLDFSPAAQDAAAVALIERRGAYADVINGDFDRALIKLKNEWEAFNRIISGTYYLSLDQAKNFYAAQGGMFA